MRRHATRCDRWLLLQAECNKITMALENGREYTVRAEHPQSVLTSGRPVCNAYTCDHLLCCIHPLHQILRTILCWFPLLCRYRLCFGLHARMCSKALRASTHDSHNHVQVPPENDPICLFMGAVSHIGTATMFPEYLGEMKVLRQEPTAIMTLHCGVFLKCVGVVPLTLCTTISVTHHRRHRQVTC